MIVGLAGILCEAKNSAGSRDVGIVEEATRTTFVTYCLQGSTTEIVHDKLEGAKERGKRQVDITALVLIRLLTNWDPGQLAQK